MEIEPVYNSNFIYTLSEYQSLVLPDLPVDNTAEAQIRNYVETMWIGRGKKRERPLGEIISPPTTSPKKAPTPIPTPVPGRTKGSPLPPPVSPIPSYMWLSSMGTGGERTAMDDIIEKPMSPFEGNPNQASQFFFQ
jgi:hypothetical protein